MRDLSKSNTRNYGKHYLSFEAQVSIKQENIPFYSGGALILYLLEIENYTPLEIPSDNFNNNIKNTMNESIFYNNNNNNNNIKNSINSH